MTTIITRYFDSATKARSVRGELIRQQRFSPRIIDLFEESAGLVDALTAQNVEADTAQAYADRMGQGGAVILVRAGYKPLSVANTTRDVTEEMGAADMGSLNEEVYVADPFRPTLSILEDHPLVMSRPRDPDSTHHAMADWPIPLLSRRKPFNETIVPRHGRMANFPIRLISKRTPKDRSIFPRHQRMANFPFPLLINGKTGKNALIPDGPRMANFPINLISKREPYTGSVIGRHSRMASFPMGLISKRKPNTASIIGRHTRMASFPIPLLIKGSDFSFSKLLGLPTLSDR